MRLRSLNSFVVTGLASFIALVAQPAWAKAPAPLQRNPLGMSMAEHPGAARFAIVGDGGTADGKQRGVASSLLRQYQATPFSDLLLLGDNVYNTGAPEKFESTIGRPYRPLVTRGVRLLPILGNHDAFTQRGTAQLKYLGLGNNRWYRTTLANGRVDLFALDTTVFVDDAWIYRDARSQDWRMDQAEKQLAWMDEQFGKSTAPFKIVMGHHPLYSSGTRALERFQMRTAFGDVLHDNHIDAYLAGHQHIYERREPIHGVVHFVSGGGGRDPFLLGGRGRLPNVHRVVNHTVLFEDQGEALGFEAVAADGTSLDRGRLRPRR